MVDRRPLVQRRTRRTCKTRLDWGLSTIQQRESGQRNPAKILPVIGTSKAERIIEAVKSLEIVLDRQQWFSLLKQVSGEDVP